MDSPEVFFYNDMPYKLAKHSQNNGFKFITTEYMRNKLHNPLKS